MIDKHFIVEIENIIAKDPRYPKDAYIFVGRAVSYTMEKLRRDSSKNRHITGKELIDGLLELAVKEYGPLAYEVLSDWGIKSDKAIGQIVFNMIEHKLLSKSDSDSINDFDTGMNIKEILSTDKNNYQPQKTNKDLIIE